MNKRGHVLNAALLGVGIGAILEPTPTVEAARSVVAVTVPVTLGALFPDVDTTFGTHRKTLHNLPVLAAFLAFPFYFDNLQFVWIGVLTHYVLDVVGTTRGIALLYPLTRREFGLPFGIPVSSDYSDVVTLLVTAVELAAVVGLVYGVDRRIVEYGGQVVGI